PCPGPNQPDARIVRLAFDGTSHVVARDQRGVGPVPQQCFKPARLSGEPWLSLDGCRERVGVGGRRGGLYGYFFRTDPVRGATCAEWRRDCAAVSSTAGPVFDSTLF